MRNRAKSESPLYDQFQELDNIGAEVTAVDAIEVPAVENATAVEVATVELVVVPTVVAAVEEALRRGLRGRLWRMSLL